jgi:NAD-dependent dihydropyrimidine dehydrogenase PreA subunit
MTGVITDKCIKCKHMDCVEVCPVDCFYEGKNMLVINPTECVDCGCCIEQCPVDAIVFETEPEAAPWMELNAAYSKIWPNVTFKGNQTPPDAAQFSSETGKFERYFSPEPGEGDASTPNLSASRRACRKCDDASAPSFLKWLARFFR